MSYTECRQLKPSVSSITMRQQPCKDAPSMGLIISGCERFQYLASGPPKVSECAGSGDFSCWIEVIYNGVQGWIPSASGTSCGRGSNPSDTSYVAYCPAYGCPAKREYAPRAPQVDTCAVGLVPVFICGWNGASMVVTTILACPSWAILW